MPQSPNSREKPRKDPLGAGERAHRRPAGQAPGQAAHGAGAKAPAGIPPGAITLASHPIVYLNVPKSACTTIKNQLYFMEHGRYIDEPLDIHSNDGLVRSRHNTPAIADTFAQRLREKHIVFTFVRHPGKRAYSCFSEKICHDSKWSFPKVRDYIKLKYGMALPDNWGGGYTADQHRDNFLKFLAFVRDNFAGKTDIRSDAHWGRQSSIIHQFQKYFFIDLIGRVETFEAQFSAVLDQTPMRHRPDLNVRFNEGPKPPFRYEEVVDGEVERQLHEIYADDYDRLGYGSSAPAAGGQ